MRHLPRGEELESDLLKRPPPLARPGYRPARGPLHCHMDELAIRGRRLRAGSEDADPVTHAGAAELGHHQPDLNVRRKGKRRVVGAARLHHQGDEIAALDAVSERDQVSRSEAIRRALASFAA